MTDAREHAQALAREHLERGTFIDWFEELYDQAAGDPSVIPWARAEPNPLAFEWIERHLDVKGARALVVGCGLGDDAERLAELGAAVVAVDIAPTAIDWCRRRFPESGVMYAVGDVLHLPTAARCFDVIVECYTIQSLRPETQPRVMQSIAGQLARGGTLIVVCRGRDDDVPAQGPPWFIAKKDLDEFKRQGLTERAFDDVADSADPAARRFRAIYTRS